MELINTFRVISFDHIHKELNSKAYNWVKWEWAYNWVKYIMKNTCKENNTMWRVEKQTIFLNIKLTPNLTLQKKENQNTTYKYIYTFFTL